MKEISIIKIVLVFLVLAGLLVGLYLASEPVRFRIRAGREGEAFLFLMPAEARLKPGEVVNFSVKIDTGKEAASGVETSLSFNPNFLRLVGQVKPGAAFPDLSSNLGQGRISLRGQGAVLGQGRVATLSFEALSPGEVNIEIDQSSLVWDEKGKRNILRQVSGATVIIE